MDYHDFIILILIGIGVLIAYLAISSLVINLQAENECSKLSGICAKESCIVQKVQSTRSIDELNGCYLQYLVKNKNESIKSYVPRC